MQTAQHNNTDQSIDTRLLEKSAVFKIVLNDNVSDGIHDKLHIPSVRGACKVCVDVL